MKVVCFSLWGNKPKYNVGAIRNAYLVKRYYPSWVGRFYVHEETDQSVLSELRSAGAQVILMQGAVNWNALFWRFSAASDDSVQIMISRDCDSRIYQREVDAVEAWLRSTANLHIMRDHPYHFELMLGGMWGAKRPIFDAISLDMQKFIALGAEEIDYGVDQKFLRIIYQKFRNKALVHDNLFEGFSWPCRREELKFVGQIYDENENTPSDHIVALKYTIRYRQNMNTLARVRTH